MRSAASVANSVRSHYDRRDIQQLFQLQPRAAQKLLELLPTVQIGTSRLAVREALAAFLDRLHNADDTSALLEQLRQEKPQISRRKARSLVRRDLDPVDLTSLPQSISLVPGRLEIHFHSVEELAEAMLTLARILENDGDAFAQAYEPPPPLSEPEASGIQNDLQTLFAELHRMETERGLAAVTPDRNNPGGSIRTTG